MTRRLDKLDRLRTAFECSNSWEEMSGDGCRRICGSCQKPVYDFAQMTQSQIRARLQASRGRVCARVTRIGGRLLVREPVPVRRSPRISGATSSVVAGLVTVLLDSGATSAQAPSDPVAIVTPSGPVADAGSTGATREGDASLRGKVIYLEDQPLPGATVQVRRDSDGFEKTAIADALGEFVFERLPEGRYTVEATLEGFDKASVEGIRLVGTESETVALTASVSVVMETVSVGGVSVSTPALRQAFEEAEVVLFATLGESQVGEVDREAQIIEVQTKLHVAQVFKGEAVGRTAIYRHWIGWSAENEVIAAYLADFAPGTEVLAILNESEERVGLLRKKAYESFQRDLEVLSADTKAAYLDRLKALVAVGKDSEESELGPEPAALAEWLVATAEDPSTRGEATAELAEALETLQKFVQEEGRRPEGLGSEELLIAAALDDRQKARLSEALLATDRFNEGDRGLFTVVQSWDSDLALDWLINQLRRGEPVNLYPEDFEWLPRLARQFEASEIQAFADVAEESLYALWEPLMDDDSAASKRRYEEESEKLGRELMVELADLLERR